VPHEKGEARLKAEQDNSKIVPSVPTTISSSKKVCPLLSKHLNMLKICFFYFLLAFFTASLLLSPTSIQKGAYFVLFSPVCIIDPLLSTSASFSI
jgi:hypothetical protein